MTIAQIQALTPGQELHFQPPGSPPILITVQSNDGQKVVFIQGTGTLTFIYAGLTEVRELTP